MQLAVCRRAPTCRVSASLVTRLNTRPLLNSPRAVGARYSTFLNTSCTSSARRWYPAHEPLKPLAMHSAHGALVCWLSTSVPSFSNGCGAPQPPKSYAGRACAHGALEVLVIGQRAQLQADQHERGVHVPARAALPGRHHVQQQVQEHGPHELRAGHIKVRLD